MIIMTIGHDPKSFSDTAEANGLSATSQKSCAARKLARMLVADGCADEPVTAVGADGKARYTVRSLYAFARKSIKESPAMGQVWWQDNPAWPSPYGAIRKQEVEAGIGLSNGRKIASRSANIALTTD